MIRIGIDLGGTKIEVVALDERGQEIVRERVLTPAGDYEATLRCERALEGDQVCASTLARYEDRMARAYCFPLTFSPLTTFRVPDLHHEDG